MKDKITIYLSLKACIYFVTVKKNIGIIIKSIIGVYLKFISPKPVILGMAYK